jgi:hypothetical protein
MQHVEEKKTNTYVIASLKETLSAQLEINDTTKILISKLNSMLDDLQTAKK